MDILFAIGAGGALYFIAAAIISTAASRPKASGFALRAGARIARTGH